MHDVTHLKCKNCGANIKHNESEDAYTCEYCNSSFVITNGFLGNDANDYIIRAGILEKYVGCSIGINIPNTVLVIGEKAFENLDTIKAVNIPSSVTKIADGAFMNCTSLSEMIIPLSVKHIGCQAFKNTGLKEISLSENIEYIGSEAFMECKNLKTVTLPQSLPQNCVKTFKNCIELREVNPNGLTICAPSFRASSEVSKNGDTRPTFFDIFQGTPYFNQLNAKYLAYRCIFCDGHMTTKKKCSQCGADYYIAPSGCYIATAVYGSYDCPSVWTLRRYRDESLAKTFFGRKFIKVYYATSPTIVKYFGNKKTFVKFSKSVLDRFVLHLQKKGYSSEDYDDKTIFI